MGDSGIMLKWKMVRVISKMHKAVLKNQGQRNECFKKYVESIIRCAPWKKSLKYSERFENLNKFFKFIKLSNFSKNIKI